MTVNYNFGWTIVMYFKVLSKDYEMNKTYYTISFTLKRLRLELGCQDKDQIHKPVK